MQKISIKIFEGGYSAKGSDVGCTKTSKGPHLPTHVLVAFIHHLSISCFYILKEDHKIKAMDNLHEEFSSKASLGGDNEETGEVGIIHYEKEPINIVFIGHVDAGKFNWNG